MSNIWSQISQTVATEFSDIDDVPQATRLVLRLGLAALLGGLLGWQREVEGKDAGLRTHMLVSLGAALFVLVPAEAGRGPDELSRVVQGIVSGIGFLGAGAVLKMGHEGRIHGLTTAATIWATAAVGMSAGLGREGTAILATTFIILVLVWLRGLEVRKANNASRLIVSPNEGLEPSFEPGRKIDPGPP